MGGRGVRFAQVLCSKELPAAPAHHLTSFGAQPQAFCACVMDGTSTIPALTLPPLIQLTNTFFGQKTLKNKEHFNQVQPEL